MTREQLYNLVWSKPMTHLAKEFGISDVAIRKHCKKFDIATPPVGYWAKLAHGKRVRQPPLSTRKHTAEKKVDLVPRARPQESDEALAAAEASRDRLEQLSKLLTVPQRLSGRSHPVIQVARDQLKQAKIDNHGFLILGNTYRPTISIGRGSVQRVLRILSTLRKGAKAEEQEVSEQDGEYYWQVKEETFSIRFYETKGKSQHKPTAAELKEQARRDKRREEYPDWYSTDRKAYRLWDYHPSGRLTLELYQTVRHGWGDDRIRHRWRDSKSRPLELRLPDMFIWLSSAEVSVREKRLQHEEQLRIEAFEKEKLRIKKDRCQKAVKLERFILELVEAQQTIARVSELQGELADKRESDGWATNRLAEELNSYLKYLRSKVDESVIDTFLAGLEIDQDSPLLIPYLSSVERVDDSKASIYIGYR